MIKSGANLTCWSGRCFVLRLNIVVSCVYSERLRKLLWKILSRIVEAFCLEPSAWAKLKCIRPKDPISRLKGWLGEFSFMLKKMLRWWWCFRNEEKTSQRSTWLIKVDSLVFFPTNHFYMKNPSIFFHLFLDRIEDQVVTSARWDFLCERSRHEHKKR